MTASFCGDNDGLLSLGNEGRNSLNSSSKLDDLLCGGGWVGTDNEDDEKKGSTTGSREVAGGA